MSYPDYVRGRHPGRRALHRVADGLDAAWRGLARRFPVVVVGADLAARYAAAPRRHTMFVSLVRRHDLTSAEAALQRRYDGPLTALAVGRLDAEKNPLLLADVLALLRAQDRRWRMVIAGDGPLRDALVGRLQQRGLADSAQLRGFVDGDELRSLYRESHALLHVSWTEGVPQVLLEAFAAGLPVVATDVGGVAEATGDDAALLVRPGDATAAAEALRRVAAEPALRERLIRAGLARAGAHTLEAEAERVVEFLAEAAA
jgi:glycosyltransferase involved in cell wall biosynthesis